MSSVSKATVLVVFIIVLASCNSMIPKPTETPVPTATNSPTLTSTPTSTPEPTSTPTPTATPTEIPIPPTETPSAPGLPMPKGTPLANWEGFPIMPDALAGEGDSKSYSFTIESSPDEIQDYYGKEMAKLGWNMFASGEGDTQALLLIFMKGTDTLSVSVIPQAGGIVYVMLIK